MGIELWIALAIAVVGSGAITVIVDRLANSRQRRAENASTIVDAAMTVVDPLREEVQILRVALEEQDDKCARDIAALEEQLNKVTKDHQKQMDQNCKEIRELRRGVQILSNQVHAMDETPLWPDATT